MRTTTRRRAALVLGLGVLALNASCLSCHGGYRGRVVGADGRPIPGAFIFYSFRGPAWNPVCTSSYLRPGSVVRTDSEGRFRIGPAAHWHRPYPLQGSTVLEAAVYSTRSHSRVEFRGDPGSADLVLPDLSADPVRWYESAESMLTTYLPALRDAVDGGPRYREVPRELRRELCADLRREWELFRAKFEALPFRPGDPRSWGSIVAPSGTALASLEADLTR